MDEFNSREQSRHVEVTTGEWMLPSAALDRFDPPADMVLATAVEKELGRYGFKIGTLGLLIQIGCGSEVMQMPTIWTLPGSPPWLLGLINLRGNLVPVYELRQVLSMGTRTADVKPLVLIFDQGDKAAGIVIEDFPKPLFELSPLPNLPQLPTALSGHVRKGYIKEEMIWLEFDHASFFEALVRDGER
jgi:chemotaxis signal transduction protein